jgi:hypothetical protein
MYDVALGNRNFDVMRHLPQGQQEDVSYPGATAAPGTRLKGRVVLWLRIRASASWKEGGALQTVRDRETEKRAEVAMRTLAITLSVLLCAGCVTVQSRTPSGRVWGYFLELKDGSRGFAYYATPQECQQKNAADKGIASSGTSPMVVSVATDCQTVAVTPGSGFYGFTNASGLSGWLFTRQDYCTAMQAQYTATYGRVVAVGQCIPLAVQVVP